MSQGNNLWLYLLFWTCIGLCFGVESRTKRNATINDQENVERSRISEISEDTEWTSLAINSDNKSDYFQMMNVSYGCPVNNSLPCVAKCCDVFDVTSRETETHCAAGDTSMFLPPIYGIPIDRFAAKNISERFEFYIGDPCINGKYLLDSNDPDDSYILYANGSLSFANIMMSMSDYCLDILDGQMAAFLCFENNPIRPVKIQHILYPVGMLLSVPFLMITAIMYTAIEQFRDLNGKCITCHVVCLAVGYIFLSIVQLVGNSMSQNMCVATAFIIQFSFTACFSWLNVLSYNTYRNVKAIANRYSSVTDTREYRTFICYSLYAWYGPGILLIVSLVMDLQPDIPESVIKPKFGVQSCWFHSNQSALPYFYGPVGIFIAINLIFFVLAGFHMYKERKRLLDGESSDINNSNFKQKMKRHWKAVRPCIALFIVMGINWVMEVISWAVGGPDVIWLVTDVLNTLQGFLIFYFLVIRPTKVKNKFLAITKSLWNKIQCKKTIEKRDESRNPMRSTDDSENFSLE